ncbi:MAG: Bug family tripartite tricarboxylate transporter substrate binding protein [Janthinobacterium lividum]
MTSITTSSSDFSAGMSRRRLVAGIGALAASSLVPAAWAQQPWPSRAIKLIVPFPPGGSTDVAGRVLGMAMQTRLGNQPVVIDNKAGAAGAIGTDAVAKAAPDGYTLGVGGVGSMVALELLGRKLPYDADKNLVCVGHMGSLGLAIGVRAGLAVHDLKELVAYAKANPGKISYGTSGNGSPGHLAYEYLKSVTGMDGTHIPYRGDAPLVTDVLGGQVDVGVLTGSGAVAQARNTNLRLLAVTSSKRFAQLPGVPTVAEGGVPGVAGFDATIWNVLVAPAGTPEAVVAKLNAALVAAMDDGSVISQFDGQGLIPVKMTPRETADFVKREREKWGKVVRAANLKLID